MIWAPGPDVWLLTRYDDVRQMFSDPRVTADPRVYQRYVPPAGEAAYWLGEMPFLVANEDEEPRGRRLVSGALTSRAVGRVEDQVRKVVDEVATPLRTRADVVDLVAEFTARVPFLVIQRITGVISEQANEARFRDLAHRAVRGINPLLSGEKRAKSERAAVALCGDIRAAVAARRERRGEDLISDLIDVWGDEVPDDELVRVVLGLVSTGTETVVRASTTALVTLMNEPELMDELREDRSLLPAAVDELLRFDSGLPLISRYAREPFELRGQRIEAGQMLLLSFTGAHRDPRMFPDPDRLDLSRAASELVVFGRGAHYCVGSNVARSELRLMMSAALDFLPPGARPIDDGVRWGSRGLFARIKSLPVAFKGPDV